MAARVHRITFTGSQGSELAARLDLPAGPPRAFALFAHCFCCGNDIHAASRIANALTDVGFGVLRFDFTGLGMSDGEFANADFTSNPDDLVAAAGWLRVNHRAPQLLIGHSLGGSAVLAVAGSIAEVRTVATIGAPASTEYVTDVAEMRKALLVLHSPIDNTVGIDNAAEIFLAARHPKNFVSLDGADHLLSGVADASFAASMIGAFANRYIVDESGVLDTPAASAPVVVAETTQGPFLNHVVVGRHRLLADEPESAGGFDAGPSPYDLLGAALGACTSMTLRMYADRKQLPLDQITVEVTHGRVHADDCVECADNEHLADRTGMIDRFERVLHLAGDDLTEADLAKLLEIADKCPVHRTLESVSSIVTSLAEHDQGEAHQ